MSVSAQLRREVGARAGHRCEYCGLAQAGQEAAFHLDHVRPVAAGGETRLPNLALACVSCSLRKGDRQAAPDPAGGHLVPLFDPRSDSWERHFLRDGAHVVGQTATGRATVLALRMNRPIALAIREEEMIRGRHPPSRHT